MGAPSAAASGSLQICDKGHYHIFRNEGRTPIAVGFNNLSQGRPAKSTPLWYCAILSFAMGIRLVMERVERTVFISYRRTTNFPWALAIFQNLTQHGYDVFLDYTGIASGDFERVILGNITARAHFLVVLTPSALERCDEPEDWLRREIETALDSQRNTVPLMLEGFDFGTPTIASQLTGKLAALKHYDRRSGRSGDTGVHQEPGARRQAPGSTQPVALIAAFRRLKQLGPRQRPQQPLQAAP
jgi:TIR domain